MVVGTGLILMLGSNAMTHQQRGNKRWNFYARDYATNILRSSSPGAMGVIREDVQLFALWEKTLVSKMRKDVLIVAQGLAQSPWYQKMLFQQGRNVAVCSLRDASGWTQFMNWHKGRALWASGDANIPKEGLTQIPWGLANYLTPQEESIQVQPLLDLYVYRGIYERSKAPDFFVKDLISEYSIAAMKKGNIFMAEKEWSKAEHYMRLAQRFDKDSPSISLNRAFIHFQKGELSEAQWNYSRATTLYGDFLKKAAEYKSLPDVVDGVRHEASDAWMNRGVLAEKMGEVGRAREFYAQAITLYPANAKAPYFMAITYWNRDWNQAVYFMDQAHRLDPSNEKTKYYLDRAKSFAAAQ